MASASEIVEVRENVDEPTPETWDDVSIEELVDAHGVNGASAIIWRRKAAAFAKLVDVSEAGASHNFSELHKNALAMFEHFRGIAGTDSPLGTTGAVRIKVMERDIRE
jgi:hypothetical protein